MAMPASLETPNPKPKNPFAIIAGLSLVNSFIQQDKANKLQGRAMSLEEQKGQAMIEASGRYKEIYQKLFGKVRDAELSGLYDPDKYEEEFQTNFSDHYKNALPNLATAQSVAGYRAGDSEAVRRENLLKKGMAQEYRKGRFNARRQALIDLQGAYTSAIPELIGQTGGALAQGYGGMAGAAREGANAARGNVMDVGSLYQLYMQTQRPKVGNSGNAPDLNNTDYNQVYDYIT